MDSPRILVIGNNCFSKSNANGRTLGNLLAGYPREKLAQFCLSGADPDFDRCDNYFCVTDRAALMAFFGKKAGCHLEAEAYGRGEDVSNARRVSRNALTMLVREAVWGLGWWQRFGFWEWVDGFRPQLVLLQAGDCPFLLRLAEQAARRCQVPLVVYQSEAYFFKDFDYFQAKGLAHWVYPLFRAEFCRQFRRTMDMTAWAVYSCEALRQAYDREFRTPSETIYTAAEVCGGRKTEREDSFAVSYLGNLGVGRHRPLVEIANVLQELSPEYYLDVYGKIPSASVQQAFESCRGIRFRGFISYGEVLKIMQESDLVVHGEDFSAFSRKDLEFAFSTKIGDCLAGGTCFLLYAPEELACSRYLREQEAAWVASDRETLKKTLGLLVQRPEERERYLKRAGEVVEEKHSMEKNARRFQEILRRGAK